MLYTDNELSATEYQAMTTRTIYKDVVQEFSETQALVLAFSIGIAGEAGEVCDVVKKGIFHRHGINDEAIAEELGDLLWYISGLCTALNIDLEDVMRQNIAKLLARYPDGFDAERSKRHVRSHGE